MAIARSSFYIVNLSPPKQQQKQKPDHLKPCNYFQSKTTVQAQQTRWKIKKDVQEEESWKRRSQLYVGGMAIIIGLEIGGLNLIHQYYNNSSSTSNSNSTSSNYAVNIEVVHEEYDYQKKIAKLTKWSDKRMCPQWKLNSLESVVPENLPRPSAHRRWEAVAYSNYKTNAPSVKTSTNCFAM